MSEQEQQQPQQQQQFIQTGYWAYGENGLPFYFMAPQWQQYFEGQIAALEMLRNFQDKKWTPQQAKAYFQCLQDIRDYIQNNMLSGAVMNFNDYLNVIKAYKAYTNPLGFQLYQKQIDFVSKRNSGQPNKKQKKGQNQKLETNQSQKPQQKEKQKEKIVIRKEDPVQDIQQFKSRTWPEGKYVNKELVWTENANLIFIGHVDSGKSTLTGNLLKQLKQVDEQQLVRNKQQAKQTNMQSWQLAFIADIDPNQRKRGKTVQCSKLMFTLQNRRFTLFDAPGHKNYVPNMIMGACQSDIACLIVSARDGQFESGFEKEGQTKQHAMLARALGVQGFIVVVSKMNTVNWQQKRYNQIRESVAPFLANSCGYQNVPFIPIDSITNMNIHSRVQDSWYKGACLVEILNEVKIPQRTPTKPLRIPIVDKFKDMGLFYVYGKLASGMIEEGQTVSVLPSREYMVIKQIYNARDQKMPFALAGQNVKIRVKGLDEDQIGRGDIICSNMNYCQQSQEFIANLSVLELPDKKKLMAAGYQCIIHMHAISESIQIIKVEAKVNPETKKSITATFLKPGQTGKVIIKVRRPICLQKFDYMPALGRFTLRDQGKTIGFGQVIKIKPAKILTKEQKEQLGLIEEKQQIKEVTEKTQKMSLAN